MAGSSPIMTNKSSSLSRLDPRSWRAASLDLRSVHDAAGCAIERIPPVHGGAIVPQQQVADAPAVLIAQIGPLDVRPQCIEQRVGVRRRKSFDIRIAPAAQIQ